MSTPDSTTTWIDIYYSYLPCSYQYIPWPGMHGLTRLELSTGQMDTIALSAKFPDKTVWGVSCPTIGPVPSSTTAEVKNYNGPEYNYGIPPPHNTTSIQYQPVVPPIQNDLITIDVYRSINYPSGSGPYELHGTIRYLPVPKPTVVITNAKTKKYTFHSASPNYTATFTYLATPSGKYAPTITWTPQQTFYTKDYLNQIKPGDTLQIPVTVTATNIAGSASDTTGKLILIRSKELHHIKVFATPDSINQSDSSLITIKAYRLDNTDITSTLPGNMRVSFTLSNSGGTLNSYNCSLDSAVNNQIKFRPNPMATGITKTKVFATLDGKYTDDTTVTIKGCPTPIPMCGGNNNFPQRFDSSWFEIYKEGDIFNWKDTSGVQKSAVIDICDYVPQNSTSKDTKGRLGYTYPLTAVSPSIFATDLHTNAGIPQICLDKITDPSTPQWRFTFLNIRIPISMTTCPREGFTDMGSTWAEWSAKIHDKSTYKKVKKAMDWWVIGSYVNKNDSDPYNNTPPFWYTFKSMLMAHEKIHLRDYKKAFTKELTEALEMVGNSLVKQTDYPCFEDAKIRGQGMAAVVRTAYLTARGKSISEQTEREQTAMEIKTDEDAIPEREEILADFKEWAKTQPWYK